MRLDWLDRPDVARLFEVLGAPGLDVRVVGGCVRASAMGLPVGEIDAATPEAPDAVMRRLDRAGLRAIPTGLAHGTVTALIDGRAFEITTLRRDTACDGRHAVVAFTTDWAEDARRRDFTFNAMSLRRDGTLFDYFQGMKDAEDGRVRFVGNPSDRIQEDYLRILRLFRFFAWYGRADIDAATLAACRRHVEGLSRLSAERIQAEFVKILGAPAPEAALELMKDCGVVGAAFPELVALPTLAALTRLEKDVAAPADWRRRLASCVPESRAEALALRLKFSAADRLRLQQLTAAAPPLDASASAAQVRAALYHAGPAVIRDRLLLAWAAAKTRGPATDDAHWRDRLAQVAAWSPRELPVAGADVLALGVPQGREVGAILGAVEAWWIAQDFGPGREEALAELRRITRKS